MAGETAGLEDLEGRIRRFLLGKLDEAERQELELQLAADPSAFSRMREIEDELIQDYAEGRLPSHDLAQFEAGFPMTPERSRKLRFARAFRSYLKREGRDRESGWRWSAVREFLGGWLSFPRPVLVTAAACLVLAGGLCWTVIRLGEIRSELVAARQTLQEKSAAEEQVRQELERERTGTAGLQQELDRLRVERNALETRIEELQQRPASPLVATFLLAPGLLRDAGPANRLQLGSGDRLVELALDIGMDDYRGYRAALLAEDGSELAVQNRLTAAPYGNTVAVRLWLPTALLVPGQYTVRLNGWTSEGRSEVLFDYAFRVTR